EAFRKNHPEVELNLNVAVGLAPADRIALGPNTQEVFHNTTAPYVDKYLREPFRVQVSLGTFDTKGKVQALGVFVHRNNPLARITLAQLDAVFSNTRRRGQPETISTWGALGLEGEWAARPIHLYGRKLDQDVCWLFRQVVLFD